MEVSLYKKQPSGCCATITINDELIDIQEYNGENMDVHCCMKAANKLRILADRFEHIAALGDTIHDCAQQNNINYMYPKGDDNE